MLSINQYNSAGVCYPKKSNRVSFLGANLRLNLKDVSETLCNDYFQKRISPFENPLFYKYLSKDSDKLDSLLSKLYKRKVGSYYQKLEDAGIEKKHRVLLVDPEVSSRIDELVQYVGDKKVDTKKVTPFELRKGFSDYLGTETVYRGLNAEDGEELISKLKEEGIYPKFHTEKESVMESIKYYLTTQAKPVWNVFSKIRDVIGGKPCEFMPVSSIYDVAASVSKNSSNCASTPSVVIKAEVPKLSVIKQKGDFAQRFPLDCEDLVIGDKVYNYGEKRAEIEAFVPFYIPTKNAEYTIDRHTPDYRWGN